MKNRVLHNAAISDLFFSYVDPGGETQEEADQFLTLLKILGVKDLPSIDALTKDYFDRL